MNNIAENNGIITFGVVNGDGTEPSHGYEPGDVNHDGDVNIADVTLLIDYLLGNQVEICTLCADVDFSGDINIADVTGLIDNLLGVAK